jgi:hypothetical protein
LHQGKSGNPGTVPFPGTGMADDLYDFTGVSFDLELLRSELKSLQVSQLMNYYKFKLQSSGVTIYEVL